ncbi:voltage-gated potassium channel [Solimonas aquatica]|uniref:Voltage-gated potassium channel n=1 Tax=Solimonas aquatica TaxID=489703 RepID=A0A1H9KYW2_9GAMM|nr:potassium channel protein [Solimonas aquatica]SER04189.1 voltage-gated potassium channel [Solimonas aquatica]
MPTRKTLSASAEGIFGSPLRNVAGTLVFVALVFVFATAGYMHAGWSFSDAAYMVTFTVFSVGYGEVHAVTTPYLRGLTIATIVLGCTGMIVLTGALVQLFTVVQIRRMLGVDRMQTQIDRLHNHIVICGFGRIGVQLSKELSPARSDFVIIEHEATRVAEAQALGFLCIQGDATDENALKIAGIERAKILATVLPNDAANVFITLSARSLNPRLTIIARGEEPSTESKLAHAGADQIVLPTHIGAERIAEMILYPATLHFVDDSPQMREMKRGLHELGLELEVVSVPANGALTGVTVAEAEQAGRGAFFVVHIDRASGQSLPHPSPEERIEAGDKIVLVARGNKIASGTLFTKPRERFRTGRIR